jgi:hypothetical protein
LGLVLLDQRVLLELLVLLDLLVLLVLTVLMARTEGLATGGDQHQVLAKASDTDYDTEWVNVAVTQRVKNVSGGELAKGTPVHAVTEASPQGQLAYVIAARADTASAMPATFVLNETLADEAEGQAIVVGLI